MTDNESRERMRERFRSIVVRVLGKMASDDGLPSKPARRSRPPLAVQSHKKKGFEVVRRGTQYVVKRVNPGVDRYVYRRSKPKDP